jgi:hypothetical protein
MSNNEEKQVKELKKEYGAVKEKEHKSKDSMKKNQDAFNKKTQKTDNEYQKAINSLDQELEQVKELYVQKQESQKELYKGKVGQIQKQLKELTKNHEAVVKSINDTYLKKQSDIKKEAQDLKKQSNEHLSLLEEKKKESEKEFEGSREDIDVAFDDSVTKHSEQGKEVTDDLEQKLENVKQENKAAIDEIIQSTEEQVQKLEQQIEIEKSAKEEKLSIIKDKFEEQSSAIEEKRVKTEEEFDKQMKALDESIEHKTARHEKFMEKSEKDHDERAMKLHRNEIKNLHKMYEKDLHDLQKNKQSAITKLDQELDNLKSHFLQEKMMLEKSCKQQTEEIIYQIELLKAEENHLVEKKEMSLEVDLKAAAYQFEEAKISLETNELVLNENKDGSLLKLQAEEDIKHAEFEQNEQLILRDIDINEAKKECAEQIAIIEKEAEISRLNLDLSIDEASAHFDLETEKKRHTLEKEILCYEEQIAHYENDFKRQQALKNEYVSYQTMVKSLEQNQLKEAAEYDEEETKNRYQLKISYLESLLPMIKQDKEMLLNKITKQFSLETAMYEEQIELISTSRLEEIEEIKKEFDKKVEKVIAKRDQLDPNAYKREIKDYNHEIKELEQQKDKTVKQKQEELKEKTELYHTAKTETEQRKKNAISEATAFFDKEEDHIKQTIQLLKDELDKELYNKDSYLQKMKDDALHYETFTKELAHLMDDQNNKYLEGRIEKAKEQIKELRDRFEDELKERKLDLKEETDQLENLKAQAMKNKEEKINLANKDYEQKVAVINEQRDKAIKRFETMKKERLNKVDTKANELDHIVKQKIESRKADLIADHTRLKKMQKDHEKQMKKLESQHMKTKKLIFKKYQASLKKELDTISRRRVS